MRLLATLPGVQKVRVDYCQVGTAGRKPTTALVFGSPMFKQRESVCTSRGFNSICARSNTTRVPLVGHTEDTAIDKQVFRTSIVEPYPPELCFLWAQLITDAYKRRRNGPPYLLHDYNQKIRWFDIDVDCSGQIVRDRFVLSFNDAWHSCQLKL